MKKPWILVSSSALCEGLGRIQQLTEQFEVIIVPDEYYRNALEALTKIKTEERVTHEQ